MNCTTKIVLIQMKGKIKRTDMSANEYFIGIVTFIYYLTPFSDQYSCQASFVLYMYFHA